jgi:thiamine-monophosphate kinase
MSMPGFPSRTEAERRKRDMSGEADFITSLRALATHPAARGLRDDVAVLEVGGTSLVLSHDSLVENVHFLPGDPPEDVAWKLVAVNLSDLAGKGGRPLGALLSFSLGHEGDWERAFVAGLARALAAFDLALLGGDTVALPRHAPRMLGLTVIGTAAGRVPSRADAQAGDLLWLSGSVGDAHAGLRIAKREREGPEQLVERYRQPRPRLEAGERLVPLVGAMMDVSDGLLLDARRLADASGVCAVVELESVPLSQAYLEFAGDDRGARISATTAGDDYELLFTTRTARAAEILQLGAQLGLPLSRIGRIEQGSGLKLLDRGQELPLPPRLGYEHE